MPCKIFNILRLNLSCLLFLKMICKPIFLFFAYCGSPLWSWVDWCTLYVQQSKAGGRLNHRPFIVSLHHFISSPPLPSPSVLLSPHCLPHTDLTSVTLLQKTPSSPVRCFATGFYPNTAEMFWRRDGEKIQNDEEPSEILPNHDDTYQMSVDLNVSAIASEDWKRYDCVFKLGNKTIATRLEKAAISTNWDPVSSSSEFPLDLAIGLVVGLILLCFCITGLFLWKNVNNASKYPDIGSYHTYPGK
uniref:Ig-like domain-containing protein n=1 Tax=Poecilia mexicana TaxID=48701 RepID=A0A3B3XD61_9TELE